MFWRNGGYMYKKINQIIKDLLYFKISNVEAVQKLKKNKFV